MCFTMVSRPDKFPCKFLSVIEISNKFPVRTGHWLVKIPFLVSFSQSGYPPGVRCLRRCPIGEFRRSRNVVVEPSFSWVNANSFLPYNTTGHIISKTRVSTLPFAVFTLSWVEEFSVISAWGWPFLFLVQSSLLTKRWLHLLHFFIPHSFFIRCSWRHAKQSFCSMAAC